ncbi:hypothetical protein AVEN_7276-1 [Araneus ventricosus]|uniref:Ionotropic glutamate receptor L-glutamate and glycine-binding domain-containing protein n=1 Tax=Araneus ventricosus TaxID=182803 RepID=A0A4Y2I6P1_ARAVE|nr:hypothetical protein AVEN_7276-1 [Araneus ventricosus]
MEISRTFKRIFFPDRDIEKRVAISGIIDLSPRSPNLSPSHQNGGQVSISLLNSLNEGGMLIASVSVNAIDRYHWPEKYSLQPPFDGYVMTVRIQNTDEVFREVIRSLKRKFLFGPHQRWIIGIRGCLNLEKALHFFDEGDKIVIIASETAVTSSCASDSISKDFKLWSLHSSGNGSTFFQQKNLSNILNDTGQPEEQLFDTFFTNFGGRILRISSLGSPPIQESPLPGDWKWRGYIFRIVNILSDMYNFTYVVKEANDRLYGMLEEDGTWPGMIGELVNKSVDMGVGDLSWTMDRSVAVDLTETIFSETVTFIYRAPGFYSRTWILFQDIDLKVWISLTFAMILGCTVYCLTLHVTDTCGNEVAAKMSEEELFVKSAIRSTGTIYRALLGQSIVHHPQATSCRTLLGTWFMGALILSSLYGGSLTSTLSLHRSPRPADTLQDLVKRYPNAILALRNNSQIHSYIKKSELWHHIWLKNIQKNVIPGKFHIKDTMEEVHRPRPEGAPIYVWIAER